MTSKALADCTDNTRRALCERIFARIRRAEDSADCSARFCAEPGSAGIDDEDFRDKASRKTSTIDPHARIARHFERGPRMAELPRSVSQGEEAHHAGVHASVPQRGHTCIMDRLRFEPGGWLLRQRL